MAITAPDSFNPTKHPVRAARRRDAELAEKAKVLAMSFGSPQAAKMLGISRIEAEQLAARHGFAFKPTSDY